MPLGITIPIKGDVSNLSGALDQASGKSGGFGVSIGSSALKMAAFAGAVGIAANVVADLTTAAAEDEAEQQKLDAAIRAATGSTADHTAEVNAAIEAGQAKAFSDSQTREALQSLVTTTGDLTSAQALLATAQDVARFAGVDLATAADAVAKANEGQAGALQKLMPGLEKGATAQDTLANASKAAAGQADAYAKSAAGMQAIAGDAFGELGEQVGGVFLEAVKAILPALLPVIKALGSIITAILPILTPMLKLLGLIISGLAMEFTILANGIAMVIKWITDAITWIGKLIDSVGPLKAIGGFIGGIVGGKSSGGGSSAGARSRGARGASSGSGFSAPLVVNVYATGDTLATESAVIRALRRETRLNGGTAPSWAPL